MYNRIDELYAQIDEIEETLKNDSSINLIEELESLKEELDSLHKELDRQRLEEKEWEVRTGHSTETTVRPLSLKNSVNYIVCHKSVSPFNHVCITLNGYLIHYTDKESSELEYIDERFYSFGYTETEAIVKAFEYEE